MNDDAHAARAAEARLKAKTATDPEHRTAWLRVAAGWESMIRKRRSPVKQPQQQAQQKLDDDK